MLCILLHTSSTRILLNGEPGSTIRHQRGLRQGDLLPPMLFIIVLDTFTTLVHKAKELQLLQPLAARQLGHRVSIDTDDVMLFASTAHIDIAIISTILKAFGDATGLRVNMQKSSVLPIQCDEQQQHELERQLSCTIVQFPCKHLELPLSLRRLRAEDLQPILDRIADHCRHGKHRYWPSLDG